MPTRSAPTAALILSIGLNSLWASSLYLLLLSSGIISLALSPTAPFYGDSYLLMLLRSFALIGLAIVVAVAAVVLVDLPRQRALVTVATDSNQSLDLPPPFDLPGTSGVRRPIESSPPMDTSERIEELPTTPADPEAIQTELREDEAHWTLEFASTPLPQLIAHELRLRAEFDVELNAEVERRFKDGEYRTYLQGLGPTDKIYGARFGRGDETHYRVVDIDFRHDSQFFVKQKKANWLRRRIAGKD